MGRSLAAMCANLSKNGVGTCDDHTIGGSGRPRTNMADRNEAVPADMAGERVPGKRSTRLRQARRRTRPATGCARCAAPSTGSTARSRRAAPPCAVPARRGRITNVPPLLLRWSSRYGCQEVVCWLSPLWSPLHINHSKAKPTFDTKNSIE